eukprot:TRINITY_DN3187_c0_g1_i2.p1 TRINITY_DN3187_c0_g1~~TRINITY_DN3187_c0_g1_i2.p1  ORF type:complete len:104 (+),score=20.41 TRINITY_DN3187_c0_g1_i2:48-314(+)
MVLDDWVTTTQSDTDQSFSFVVKLEDLEKTCSPIDDDTCYVYFICGSGGEIFSVTSPKSLSVFKPPNLAPNSMNGNGFKVVSFFCFFF